MSFAMLTFVSSHGTRFTYRNDLEDEVYIQVSGEAAEAANRVRTVGTVVTTLTIPLEDLVEFADHLRAQIVARLARGVKP